MAAAKAEQQFGDLVPGRAVEIAGRLVSEEQPRAADQSTGDRPAVGGLNIGHLYQILERLERDGYVAASRVSQSSRPDKTLYTLTAAGAEELRGPAWTRTAAGCSTCPDPTCTSAPLARRASSPPA